jgi:hypothetical protein
MLAPQAWMIRVHGLRDDDGRPLGEHRAPSAGEAEPAVAMELAACPYPGSRAAAGKPINVSALHATLKHWRTITGLLARARAETPGATVIDVWRAGQTVESLPYLVLFARRAGAGASCVPSALAAAYKVMLGTNAGLLGYWLERPPDTALPSADDLLTFVEQRGLLVGPAQACAGPEALIREALEILLDGGRRHSAADEIFDARPGAVAFGRARASLLATRLAFALSAYALFADLRSQLGGDVPPALADALERARPAAPSPDQQRFAAASSSQRRSRLEGLLRGADGAAELLPACADLFAPGERASSLAQALSIALGPGLALDALCQAEARERALADACRSVVAQIKRGLRGYLPADVSPDPGLELDTVRIPAGPVRRVVDSLVRPL